MLRLTPKQRLFCEEYLVDLNATQAAIRAGYSEKTARKIGQENLTKPDIHKAIQRSMDERVVRTNVDADRVVNELAKIGFSDIKKFIEFGPEESVEEINNVNSTRIIRSYNCVRLRPDSELDGTALSEIKVINGNISIKLHDKLKALELLGKHLGMFVDKHEVGGKDGTPIIVRFVRPDA